MGCIGKVAMPLLSTLAALVIIVHTAEENYEREQRQLRSMALDLAAPSYDQTWSSIEVEPMMTQASENTQIPVWDNSPDEVIRRRRPGRKRKRRPQLMSEDLQPQDRYIYHDGPRPQMDNIDRPRRRRKKTDYQDPFEHNRRIRWSEEGSDTTVRRRGQRRKRPYGKSRPEQLSEFGRFPEQNQPVSEEKDIENKELPHGNYQDKGEDDNDAGERLDSEINFETTTQVTNIDDFSRQDDIQNDKEDKSLSEFSTELINPVQNEETATDLIREKLDDKTIVINDIEKTKDKKPLDPNTLKAILKRSNGKSLSEILLQHNLSLSDLLKGNKKAISVLETENLNKTEQTRVPDMQINDFHIKNDTQEDVNKNEARDMTTEIITTTRFVEVSSKDTPSTDAEPTAKENLYPDEETTTRGNLRRRFPTGVRRKLRMRPVTNNTYKGQLSRDLIALTSIKYRNNRNASRHRDWKDIMPAMTKLGQPKPVVDTEAEKITTTTISSEDMTTTQTAEITTDASIEYNTLSLSDIDLNTADSKRPNIIINTNNKDETILPLEVVVTEKPKITLNMKPQVNASDLRRQAFNNRLKRKRMKQRVLNTDLPEESHMKDIFAMGDFVLASEFIAKTQTRTTKADEETDFTTLEDFLTTESTSHSRTKKPLKHKTYPTFVIQKLYTTTEETAKYEIEEILHDNLASARLSKILKERNMTLNELVEHRERGSSHLHLADIFHNASKEPNPPEPFLSKSLIEPISKETYPLRALLEANLHDPKTTTIDPSTLQANSLNIPVVMDFGNNVNENGENMGIMSLFNNFSNPYNENLNANGESDKSTYDPLKIDTSKVEVTREGRKMNPDKEQVTWNNLITLMQKNQDENNKENPVTSDQPISDTLKKVELDEDDIEDDGLIALKDLQSLSKNFESKGSSDELLEIKLFESNESPQLPVMDSASNTKSVTVATASIIGLALILFLLTYVILKWKQQNKMFEKKHAMEDECVPTPVFENRKGQTINSSTRSKSPMLSSNIYAIDSLDTHVGTESPEYMWDTLRKPFQ